MRGLLKFTLLIFAFCLNLFSFQFPDPNQYSLFMNLNYFSGMRQIDAELISDEYFRYRNDIYKIASTFDYFVLSPSKFNDFAIYASDFYFFNPTPKTAYCEGANTDQTIYSRNCSVEKIDVRQKIEYQNVKKISVSKVATCEPGENFNTSTQKCQSCPSGQSWNPETNSCFNDCSDINKNKYGFTDGSCADCSGEKDSDGVKKCYCNFMGSSPLLQSVELVEGNFCFTSCQNGSQFWYKIPGTPDVDSNKTNPDLKKPNPGGNGTNPDDPNNPVGGNNQGNNGGNQGNPKPNPNQGNNTNPNPDPKPNPKPGNGNSTNNDGNNNGGGGNNANGDNLKFTPDGSADKYQKDINDFAGKFKEAAGSIVGEFSNFKKGVDQLIANIEGKGIKDVKSQAIPSSCPREFTVDMFGNSYLIKIDYCKYIAPAANVLYYIFYILFFLAFLLGVYKTVLFLI